MYGGSTFGDGKRVSRWEAGDGSVGARTTMRDGRSYAVVGCVGMRVGRPGWETRLRRAVTEQVELVLMFDGR